MPASVKLRDSLKNHLIAALHDEELARVQSKLEAVSFNLGDVLYESGDKMDYAYFPTTMIVSMLYIMENGGTAEIGIVGNDGLIGNALFMGGDTTTSRAIIQSAGKAFRMKAKDIKAEFALGGVFQNMLLRHTQALITQIPQTAVCNRLHPIEQQLCRWLLLSHDRLDSNELVMTHDLISNMLGVRREAVTRNACNLQRQGLINYYRGNLEIVNPAGLEAAACSCYAIIKERARALSVFDITHRKKTQ